MTTREQFRACIADPMARKAAGIALSDEQALQILANDELTDQWYQWWSHRPSGFSPGPTNLSSDPPLALVPATSWSAPVRPTMQPELIDGGEPVSLVQGVLSVAAGPTAIVLWIIWLTTTIGQSYGGSFVSGLVVTLIFCVAIAGAGVALGVRSILLAQPLPFSTPARGAAVALGVVGLVLDGIVVLLAFLGVAATSG